MKTWWREIHENQADWNQTSKQSGKTTKDITPEHKTSRLEDVVFWRVGDVTIRDWDVNDP